jgi:hypothetical protein
MKLRLVHTTFKTFGSKITQHRWAGQIKTNDLWEYYTVEYDTEQEAELNLLRLITEDYGFVFEPTFDLQDKESD